jgi:serine/threonine-protein kinase HipA
MKNYKNKNPLYASLTLEQGRANDAGAVYQTTATKCLYCYEPIKPSEGTKNYHKACCKKFFGQAYEPVFDYNASAINELAKQYLQASTGVTGVQAKLSLSWYKKQAANSVKKLTIVGLYGDFILKPQSNYYASLPELEHCTMMMAKVCGLQTVPHSLFALNDGELCYLTKRVDRSRTRQYHMEDMCQLTERLTEDKYKGSHEQVAKVLLKYSSMAFLDVTNFYEYVLFSYLTGNADMHLKNFSMLEQDNDNGYALAPAYDMLNTVLVNPTDKEELALTLNGKKANLKYTDFLQAYLTSGLTKKQLDATVDNFYYCQLEMQEVLYKSFLPNNMKDEFAYLLQQRLTRLTLHKN